MAYQFIQETQTQTKLQKLSLEFVLPELPDTTIQPIVTIHKAGSASEIFSSESQLSTGINVNNNIDTMTTVPIAWQDSVFLALVLSYYFFVLYRYQKTISPIFNIAFSMKKTLTFFEIQNNDLMNLTRHSVVLALLSISIYALSMMRQVVATTNSALLPLIIIGSVTIWFLYKFIIIKLSAAFSDDKESFKNFDTIISHSLSLFAITAPPIIVASAIDQTDTTIATITMITLWIYYMLRILVFFVNNGFGGLQWILYLCAVELLPISFAVAVATRLQ